MKWKTVPNLFPDYDDLDSETQYNLWEGYCIDEYKTKRSGFYYKKIKCKDDNEFHRLLSYMGFTNWHLRYKLERRWIFFRFWMESNEHN